VEEGIIVKGRRVYFERAFEGDNRGKWAKVVMSIRTIGKNTNKIF
jgi:hypothetical protein